jgi:hypothetical protein
MKTIILVTIFFTQLVFEYSSFGAADNKTLPETARDSRELKYLVVAGEQGRFAGWPANNGLWRWDDGREILVGFSWGNWVEKRGHNIAGISDDADGILSRLARSTDGGYTWVVEDPENYVGDGGEAAASPGGFVFDDPDFAMRVACTGYHGTNDPQGVFFISGDRGKTWRGPYRFSSLMEESHLKGMELTGRTRYLVTGRDSCLIFLSARPKNGGFHDKTFVAETVDGGKTFQFVAWVVPLEDPHRAVMPAVVKLEDGTIITALRRKNIKKDLNWVDCYCSLDNGRTWTFLSRAGKTGDDHNGNPPGLCLLSDGRLVCVFGNRTRAKMFVRLSVDGGKSWGKEIVLREKFRDMDFGYAQVTQNDSGEIVAMYYLASKENKHNYIEAAIMKVENE